MDEGKNMRFAHSDGQTEVCFDETGRYIISCGSDGEVRIWDGFDDDSPESHHISDSVYSVIVKDGKFYVSVDNNSVLSFKFPKGEPEGVITRFTDKVHSVTTNKNSKYLAMGSGDFKIKVVEIGKDLCKTYSGHDAPILSVAIDPSDKYLASSSCDGTIRVWDILREDCVKMWQLLPKSNDYHASKTLARISWHPTNENYLAIPVKNEVQIYERDTWNLIKTLKDESFTENVSITSFSHCGKYLAASSFDGKIVIWNFSTKEVIHCNKHPQDLGICCLTWNPKKLDVLYADNQGQFGIIENIEKSPPKEAIFRDEDLDAIFDDDSIDEGLSTSKIAKKKVSRIEDDDDDSNAIDIGAIKATYEPKIFGSQEEDKEKAGTKKKEEVVTAEKKEIVYQKVPLNVQQTPFQPGSTPTFFHHRYMLWNSIGIVCCYNTEEENSIDVEFHDTSIHHSIHLPNSLNHTMAALSVDGLVLACPADNEKQSKLVCTHFGTWDSNKEWTVEMPENEEIQAISLGKNFVVCVTSKYYVRVFSISGLQLGVFSIPGPVVCVTSFENTLLIAYHHSAGLQDSQDLGIITFMFDKGRLLQKSVKSLSLSPNSTLTWLGFTDEGTPCSIDSVGVIRLLFNSLWTPILDTKENIKGKSDTYFVIGLSELTQQVRCILCKGSRYPPTLPRPNVAILSFKMPFCELSTDKGQLEEEYCRYNHLKTLLEKLLKEDFEVQWELEISKRKIVDNLMKLFAFSSRSEREYRALEVANLMPTSRVVQGAIQYAMQRHFIALAEKLGEVAYHKQEEENKDLDEPVTDDIENEPMEDITPALSSTGSRLSMAKDESILIRPKPLSFTPVLRRSTSTSNRVSFQAGIENEDDSLGLEEETSNNCDDNTTVSDEIIQDDEDNEEEESQDQEIENQKEKSTPVAAAKKNPFQVMSQKKKSIGGIDTILQSSIDNKKSSKEVKQVSDLKKTMKSSSKNKTANGKVVTAAAQVKANNTNNSKKRKAADDDDGKATATPQGPSKKVNAELSDKTTNKISSFLFKKD